MESRWPTLCKTKPISEVETKLSRSTATSSRIRSLSYPIPLSSTVSSIILISPRSSHSILQFLASSVPPEKAAIPSLEQVIPIRDVEEAQHASRSPSPMDLDSDDPDTAPIESSGSRLFAKLAPSLITNNAVSTPPAKALSPPVAPLLIDSESESLPKLPAILAPFAFDLPSARAASPIRAQVDRGDDVKVERVDDAGRRTSSASNDWRRPSSGEDSAKHVSVGTGGEDAFERQRTREHQPLPERGGRKRREQRQGKGDRGTAASGDPRDDRWAPGTISTGRKGKKERLGHSAKDVVWLHNAENGRPSSSSRKSERTATRQKSPELLPPIHFAVNPVGSLALPSRPSASTSSLRQVPPPYCYTSPPPHSPINPSTSTSRFVESSSPSKVKTLVVLGAAAAAASRDEAMSPRSSTTDCKSLLESICSSETDPHSRYSAVCHVETTLSTRQTHFIPRSDLVRTGRWKGFSVVKYQNGVVARSSGHRWITGASLFESPRLPPTILVSPFLFSPSLFKIFRPSSVLLFRLSIVVFLAIDDSSK